MQVLKKDNYIIIKFKSKIDYKLNNYISNLATISLLDIQFIYLDFTETKYITLPGAIYIIYILNLLKNNKQKNEFIETRIINIRENIAIILAKMGFYNSTIFYGNLFIDDYIKKINYIFTKKSKLINNNSIYLPIQTIPQNSSSEFDSQNAQFVNQFIDHFQLIIKKKRINTNIISINEVESSFIKAIYELSKNVWEHSQSWGLSAIQSTKKTNSTITIADFGIGFINSYKMRNPKYESNENNDRKLIEWLLKEGNSSKSKKKNGHGISRVLKFVTLVNGVLLIRTDHFKITYINKKIFIKYLPNNYINGAQIFINF